MSINRGTDKEDVVHIYYGILLGHEKEQKGAICREMDGPRDCHTGWSKSEREKTNPVHQHIYVECSKIV